MQDFRILEELNLYFLRDSWQANEIDFYIQKGSNHFWLTTEKLDVPQQMLVVDLADQIFSIAKIGDLVFADIVSGG